jgi:Cu+-exporting ATPase
MDVLICIGTTTAFLYSVAIMFYSLHDPHFMGMVYFETSAMLICFMLLGKFLEALAKGRTSDALYKVGFFI